MDKEFANMIDNVLEFTKDKIGSRGSAQNFFAVVLKRFKEAKKRDGEVTNGG